MKYFLLSILVFVLSACSSSSDDNPPATTAINQPLPDQPQADDVSSITADNYQDLLVSSTQLLRADYLDLYVAALQGAAQFWANDKDSVVGEEKFPCNSSGTVVRTVTEAPIRDGGGVPVFNLRSTLSFRDCDMGKTTLAGDVARDWNESSPAQLGGTSSTTVYRFQALVLSTDSLSHTLTGRYQKKLVLSGPGESYNVKIDIDQYQETAKGVSRSVAQANYAQIYNHYCCQAEADANGFVHEFYETGSATVSLAATTFTDLTVVINDRLSYANVLDSTDGVTRHSTELAAGSLSLSRANGDSVTVSSETEGTATVIYILKDTQGQETTIEGDWVAPALCKPDASFTRLAC